jgi:hypothetical protein
MSLKSIEMQIALPRSIDAAKLHDQLLQKGHIQNDQASGQIKQQEVKQRTTVVKQEQKDHACFHQNGGGSHEQNHQNGKQPKKGNQQNAEKHPYKGNFLDFSG